MKHTTSSTPAVAVPQPVNHSATQPLLKLALDVHLAWHVVAVQEDGASPQPPPRFKPVDFLKWIQQKVADYRSVTCYEAGPFGYGLHRQLTALGVTNYVIRPRNWDDPHTRVKTDRTDALAMLNALDRFCAGNKKALALVRVPTETEERQRTQTRLRQSPVRDLKMIAGRACGLALQYGFSLKGHWYGRRSWPKRAVAFADVGGRQGESYIWQIGVKDLEAGGGGRVAGSKRGNLPCERAFNELIINQRYGERVAELVRGDNDGGGNNQVRGIRITKQDIEVLGDGKGARNSRGDALPLGY